MRHTIMCPEPVAHSTEFVGGYHGTCMETAAAICIANATGQIFIKQMIIDMTKELIARGQAAANGAVNINNIADYALRHSHPLLVNIGYHEPFAGDFFHLIKAHVGTHPIMVEVANGQVLRDIFDHGNDESGIHYHGLAILGLTWDDMDASYGGYICADGDNPYAETGFNTYDYDTLIRAQPCGMLVFAQTRQTEHTYPVAPGDTLYAIAGKLHISEQALFLRNQPMLDQIAHDHGYLNSENGRWIFPGTILRYVL